MNIVNTWFMLSNSCSRVIEAAPLKAIVIPATGEDVQVQLRNQDLSWKDFLASVNHPPR